MPVQSISSVNNVNFKGNKADNKNTDTIQLQNNIKDDKEKLTLALNALGAAAAADVAIYNNRESKLDNIVFNNAQENLDEADYLEIADESAQKKKPALFSDNTNLQNVKYKRKFKQNGACITNFYTGDKLVKKTTSQIFPEQKYVKIRTEYCDGKLDDEYFMIEDKMKSLLVGKRKHFTDPDIQMATDDTLNPVASKYFIAYTNRRDHGSLSVNSLQEVQDFVDELGFPFEIDNMK